MANGNWFGVEVIDIKIACQLSDYIIMSGRPHDNADDGVDKFSHTLRPLMFQGHQVIKSQ